MGLLGRVWAVCAFLILGTAGAVGWLVDRRIERDLLDEIEQSLRARAALLAPLAWSSMETPDAGLHERLTALDRETGTRLTIVREDGSVVADSREDAALMENHRDRPEIAQARDEGFGISLRHSRTVRERMMYAALPLWRDGALAGFVRTALPLHSIDARRSHIRRAVWTGTAFAALAALLPAFLLARRVTGPARTMTRAAQSIARGEGARDLPLDAPGEIGALARALRDMDGELQTRMRTLSSERNQLRDVFSGMTEGIVAIDRDEKVTHLNAAAERSLQASAAEAKGRPLWEVTRLREVCDAAARALRDGAPIAAQIRISGPSRERTIDLRAVPLRGADGTTSGAVVVLDDVTELRRLETVRRDFVANVSHEIKTPVTALRGTVETILDDPAMPPERQRRFLERAKEQALRLTALVTDLLALARAESATGEIARVPLDARSPVQETLDALRAEAEGKRHALTADLPPSPLAVLAEGEALRQIAGNLLDNAIKYTPEGGSIRVRLAADGNHALLEVSDNGIGIEPRDQERIFERFYRVDKSRGRDTGGTGLGLSIVRHLALALGGEVSVESAPGRGSVFRVRIPLEAPSAPVP
ncbi:MAG: PAS domain-containing protein [Planctomycetes bacterium]|nr:PAS domain-containing protein [Planctomycetota bacterium]